ncbi:Mannosyl phosphorylinositol ceramide synthase [Hyphodiscus hymeniophilus]|uniref:Mannosyl phosphorylinositol ceramide synthase n=1 Tax=Hyphodiscus hymeniophilus TaxID=353542 RepID=A0A9P7AY61_9HELO|nr:Mannosyl phosphorylinositol ceramide synthase [Hyphodiscus hymeniophilus]
MPLRSSFLWETCRTVRRRPRRFILLVTLTLAFLTYKSLPLLHLLTEDGSADAVRASVLFNDPQTYNNTQLIPKIIHQTYKNTTIPLRWQVPQEMILKYHGDYEYMFWTDESALDFIAENYPSYLETYISYAHPIQRADALRYFVLYHFGGIYLDLDITPRRRLDALLTLPAFACLTTPTGISNDALGAAPSHPFFLHVIKSLQKFNKNWYSPYITVMASTGPLFMSLAWKEWLDSGRNVGDGRVKVMVPEGRGYGFLVNVEGRSWQESDEKIISWLERHYLFDIICSIFAVCVSVGIACQCFDWTAKKLRRRRWIRGRRGRVRGRLETVWERGAWDESKMV